MGQRRIRGGRRALVLAVAAATFLVFGLAGVSAAVLTGGSASPGTSQSSAAGQAGSSGDSDGGLPRSMPVRLRIPAIGVDRPLDALGTQGDGKTMELPKKPDGIGWYKNSVTPGQMGTSIIAGYIRIGRSKGALANLGQLGTGDKITVRLKDGSIATFTVKRIAQYEHGTLPAAQLFASATQPVLRIVTVGGTLHSGDKPGNVVVYSHLTGVKQDRGKSHD